HGDVRPARLSRPGRGPVRTRGRGPRASGAYGRDARVSAAAESRTNARRRERRGRVVAAEEAVARSRQLDELAPDAVAGAGLGEGARLGEQGVLVADGEERRRKSR